MVGVANAYLMSGQMHTLYRVTEVFRVLIVALAQQFGALGQSGCPCWQHWRGAITEP